jgi:hypothetical protein
MKIITSFDWDILAILNLENCDIKA